MDVLAQILYSIKPKEKREIRQALRSQSEVHCLDRIAYLKTLAIAINMSLGECKAKILKSWIKKNEKSQI